MPMDGFLNHDFIKKMTQMGEMIKEYSGEHAVIVHHNDADGICSAAILSKLCELLDLSVNLICIEKVHSSIVETIHNRYEGEVVIYTDLAGLAAEMIDKVNDGRCTVWIIDHHPAKSVESETVFVFDPELFGVSGDTFVSASTLNYLLSACIHEKMKSYAYLAVIGSVGDYHDRSGGVLGFDRFVLDEAVDLGQAKIKIEGQKERYYIQFFDEFADVVAERLTTLGVVAYEKKGYRKGLKACFEGFDEETINEVEKLKEIRDKKFEEAIYMLRNGGLHIEKYSQWFHVGDIFSPMGVKAVGEFCQMIKDMVFLKEDRYILGFQNCPKYVPDIGEFEWDVVKLSGRVPLALEKRILMGQAPGLDVLIPAATEEVGGIADATHRIAAATLIDRGMEGYFIRAFEEAAEREFARLSKD
ncbi:single-stranded-DNA-specific exonuclease RecJ [Archaeoglobus veneficus]|uniref:Phosphoesterase RecJ domain protein n=1 Tax=Archaeoglobus veneficus (strain DSM 11195 / SNP6) TaxID=693661 RepID=F2KR16_ARCVS|nr:DHH family phosphoesterase [Archaeoglobus veneficus]AEA47822.1 phosphoesterase RecJ domain protein [Archaeoglobus veneficus SNP6]